MCEVYVVPDQNGAFHRIFIVCSDKIDLQRKKYNFFFENCNLETLKIYICTNFMEKSIGLQIFYCYPNV